MIIINIHVNVTSDKTAYLNDFDAIERFISSWNNKHITKPFYFSAWLTYLTTYQRKFISNKFYGTHGEKIYIFTRTFSYE